MPVLTPFGNPQEDIQEAQQGLSDRELQPQLSQQQGNLVILNDGSRHLFPAGTTVDQMHKTLNLGPVKPTQSQNWVDMIRPFISAGAGILGAAGVTAIPGVGESGVAQMAADTQSYAITDSLLKYLGANPPRSYKEALSGSEADAVTNAVAGKLLNGVFKGVKGIYAADQPEIYKLFPTTSQALESYGMKTLATLPRLIEDYGIPSAKAGYLDKSGGAGFTQALAHANAINGRTAGINSNPQKLYDVIKGQLQLGLEEGSGFKSATHYASQEALDLLEQGSDHFKVLDDVIADPDRLAKVLKTGQIAGSPAMNVKQDLAAYKFMDIVNKATTMDPKGPTVSQIAGGAAKEARARIDPAKLLDSTPGSGSWGDPEIQANLKLLYGKEGMERISNFFKDIAYTQANQSTNPLLGRYLRYSGAGKFLMGIGTLVHGISTGNFTPAGGVAGIQLGASTIGRMLVNPKTAPFVAEMAKGTFKENPAWATKMIGSVLKNQTIGVVGGDGSVTQGTMQENPQTGELEFKKD